MLYYLKDMGALGKIKTKVYETRLPIPENFNPMAHNIMTRKGLWDKIIQVRVDYLGELVWINIDKTELFEE